MAKKRANGEGSIRKRSDGRWEGRYTAGYDPETGKRAFESDFDLDETTVTLRRVKRSDYSYICPEKRTYILTKAADDEQALAALPFAPAAGT